METGHALLYLILIIGCAKVGGEIAEYFKQSAVLGELLVGVLLGLTPLRVAANDSAIAFVASIGIILLLFEVGLESELSEFKKVGTSAVLVAIIGVIIPLATGFVAIIAVRGNYNEALFLGATLTATSVGITTRVLVDMDKMKSREASIILGAAVLDDVLGLLILSIVLQIVSAGVLNPLAIAKSVLIALSFLVFSVWAGIRFAPTLTHLAQKLKTRGVLVTIAFLFCLLLSFGATEMGLAEIIGAFAAGLILATTDDRVKIHKQIKPVADIFVPVFFVLVGLQVDIRTLNPFAPAYRDTLLIGVVLLVLAVLGKLAAGLGVLSKDTNRTAVGVGMIPRGEVGLIFSGIGLKNGIIPTDLYGVLIAVVFITTLITPPWLKYLFARKPNTL